MNEITDIKRRAGIQKISQAENPEGYLQAVLDARLEFDDFRKTIQHLAWSPEVEAKFADAFGFIDIALKAGLQQASRKRNS